MNQRSATVFIVDDDDAVRSSLRLLLKSVGLSAVAYPSARDFLAAWNPEQPSCLVLDVRMPGMSGLELQEELNRRGAIVPVIFITGHGDIPMAVEHPSWPALFCPSAWICFSAAATSPCTFSFALLASPSIFWPSSFRPFSAWASCRATP